MTNPDQAEQAASVILGPAKADLEKRKKKLADALERRHSPIGPAMIAACVTMLATNNEASPIVAVALGAVAGWGFGRMAQRRI